MFTVDTCLLVISKCIGLSIHEMCKWSTLLHASLISLTDCHQISILLLTNIITVMQFCNDDYLSYKYCVGPKWSSAFIQTVYKQWKLYLPTGVGHQ